MNRRPVCAGCRHFRVVGGAFKYSCLLWGVASVHYNVAQLVYDATGEFCPFCEPPESPRPPDESRPAPPPLGTFDIRI